MQIETITSGNGAKGTVIEFTPQRFTHLSLRNRSGTDVEVFLNGSVSSFTLETGEDHVIEGRTVKTLTSVSTSSVGGSHEITATAS